MFKGSREADAVARLRHARAAGQRMAGAVGFFAHDMWRGSRARGVDKALYRADVDLSFPTVDVAQLEVAARLFVGRGQHDVFTAALFSRRPFLDDVDGTLVRARILIGHRLQGGHSTRGGSHVIATRIERALEDFHRL